MLEFLLNATMSRDSLPSFLCNSILAGDVNGVAETAVDRGIVWLACTRLLRQASVNLSACLGTAFEQVKSYRVYHRLELHKDLQVVPTVIL